MDIKLLTMDHCHYPDLFQTKEMKIGHVRADYSWRWWSTFWDVHADLKTVSRCKEIDIVCAYLLEDVFHAGLEAVVTWCNAHPEASVGTKADGEYNFFIEGEECAYWVRLITRNKDYNMYLHCYVKQQETGGNNHED